MSERGRRIELCKEWADSKDGQDFDSWLMNKLVESESRLAALEGDRIGLQAKVGHLEQECSEYWAFISALAKYFGCAEGVDMRDFILAELDKLKASATRGEALARTVMADQISNDRAVPGDK